MVSGGVWSASLRLRRVTQTRQIIDSRVELTATMATKPSSRLTF